MNDLIIIVLSYMGVFLIAFLFIGFLLRGFFFSYIKVKGSRGKLVLVKVRSLTGEYFRPGTIQESNLVYKDRLKQNKRINIPAKTNSIYRSLGVTMIDVSEELNCIVDINFEAIEGFDADKMESLYMRALYRPTILDEKQKLILILIGVLIVLTIVTIMMNYSAGKNIKIAISIAQQIKDSMVFSNGTIPTL